MEHQTTQNAIEARRSHLNGLDGEIVAYDQKIENRGTEMLFLQGYMRKQNGIKNTTVWSHINNVVIGSYIVYTMERPENYKKQKKNEKNFCGRKYGSEDHEKILAFSGSSDKMKIRYEKSTRIAVQMLDSFFGSSCEIGLPSYHF